MAVTRTEPGVESKIGQQPQTVPVTGGFNVIVPVDSPSGVSTPTLCSSTNYFYDNFGTSSGPSVNDHPSMLQAASLLNSGSAVWVVRCHKNKVFEGVTDSGEKFFIDAKGALIKNQYKIDINPVSTYYQSMWLVYQVGTGNAVCIYCGTKPDTGVSDVEADNYVQVTNSANTYEGFFEAIKTSISSISAKGVDLIINGTASTGYTVFSPKRLIRYSSNITGVQQEKIQNTATLKLHATNNFTVDNYFMLNGISYHIAGSSASAAKYPTTDEALEFINNEDIEPPYLVASYLNDIFLTKYKRLVVSCSAQIAYTYSSSNLSITKSDSIPSSMITISGGVITAKPSTETITSGWIKLKVGVNCLVVYVGDLPTPGTGESFLIAHNAGSESTVYKMTALMSELLTAFNNSKGGTAVTLATPAASNLNVGFNTSKLISMSYKLPTGGVVDYSDSYESSYLDSNSNTNQSTFTNVAIKINNVEYCVGNPALEGTSFVYLSKSPLTLKEFATKLANALPKQYNASSENNSIGLFTTSTDEVEIDKIGDTISINTVKSNFSTVERNNKFGTVLKFNSKSKVAQFKYNYDSSTGLFNYTATVNGKSYQAYIQFDDASKTDGYGKSLYYQVVNDNFPVVEIIPFKGELELTTFESPVFGDSVGFNEATSADLDDALSQLKNYKFTKWEVILDGGFVDPASYSVLNKWGTKLSTLIDGGTPDLGQLADVIDWRGNLPASTSEVTIAYPPIKDSSFDGFSVVQSAGVSHVKRIIDNRSVSNEFQPILGADRGTLMGKPIYNLTDEDDRNELLSVGINTVTYSDELKLTYVNDNTTLLTEEGPLQEENIVRMANAATHVAEIWLELNAVGHFNCLKLRDSIVSNVKETIQNRLKSAEPCYKDLTVICDSTNGNDDSKTEVYVDAYLVPYRSTKKVHLFTLVKSVTNEQ